MNPVNRILEDTWGKSYKLVSKKLTYHCLKCGTEFTEYGFRPSDYSAKCPKCGSAQQVINVEHPFVKLMKR